MRSQEPSWMERTFGSSAETSLPGYILGGGGTILMLIGLVFDSKEVIGIGTGAIGTAILLIGQFARSQGQHERDRGKLTQDVADEVVPEARRIAAAEAKEEARKVVTDEMREHDRRDQR